MDMGIRKNKFCVLISHPVLLTWKLGTAPASSPHIKAFITHYWGWGCVPQ